MPLSCITAFFNNLLRHGLKTNHILSINPICSTAQVFRPRYQRELPYNPSAGLVPYMFMYSDEIDIERRPKYMNHFGQIHPFNRV